ncbi:MAG: single-stranded-DNA-specific exonuclease RecJ [Chloroflexota bacterium]
MSYRWNLLPAVPVSLLAENPDIPRLAVQLLYNRGITDTAQLRAFLAGDSRLSIDPCLLPDVEKAAARIYRALLSGEAIAVYGDYDVDGITATALLVRGLTLLGGRAMPYIPHRLTEGYGLTITALENLRQQGISLVITVDCGITSLLEVKKARRMGLDIIVTDHHTPLAEIPSAAAVVNPKLPGSNYPFKELAGAGIAFKLLQVLLKSIGQEAQLDSLVDLAALGTIADLAPMIGENRYLVKEGLKLVNASPRLGLRELISQSGLNIGSIDAESIGWVIAPCLNAAGRLSHAMTSYNLLLTDSPREASELALLLGQQNAERQKLTSATVASAREQVLARGISPLLMAADGDYHLGIAGLVASRLADEFYRPAIVVKVGEKTSSGSCRSIPDFNIIGALNDCRRLLTRFGGHSQAAGFTLPTRNLAQLEQQLGQLAAARLEGADLRPSLDIDMQIALPDLAGDTFQVTQRLAPFGRGNPLPTFLSRGVEVISCRTMGGDNSHLRLKLRQGGTVWDGVGFRLGNLMPGISSHIDVVYNLEVDRWNGKESLRLNILDFTPATLTSSPAAPKVIRG